MGKSLVSCFLTHGVDCTVHDGTMFVNHTAFFLHKIPVLKSPAASHNGNSHSECDLKLLKIIRNLKFKLKSWLFEQSNSTRA